MGVAAYSLKTEVKRLDSGVVYNAAPSPNLQWKWMAILYNILEFERLTFKK